MYINKEYYFSFIVNLFFNQIKLAKKHAIYGITLNYD